MTYQELLHSPIVPLRTAPLIEKASRNDIPVLIVGEQGTGKELLAKIIHHVGAHGAHPFHKIDCKFSSAEGFKDQILLLLEGIEKGTPPGTLYLKEVGFLEEESQLRLLELLEDGVHRDKLDQGISGSLRVISTTSENLETKVTQGKFSEDLYDRLNTFLLRIPALRDRVEDIPAIARHLLSEHSKKMNVQNLRIADEALKLLETYWWPGNLKEFERVLLGGTLFSEGDILTEQDLLRVLESEKNVFLPFIRKVDMRPLSARARDLPPAQTGTPLPLFFIELVHRIKNPLVSIKTFTQLLRDKFQDKEYREYFYRIVTEDIERIDSVLDGLLSYIKVNTPMKKADTIHTLLDEVLKKHQPLIDEKRVKVIKKWEKDLPETTVHDEQLRYVLNAIFQFALPSIPLEGSIGVLTKLVDPGKKRPGEAFSSKTGDRWLEILILFTGFKKMADPFEAALGMADFEQEETIELELRLVKEIVRKNRGNMRVEVNENRGRTLICLRLPVERREVFYYPPTPV